MKNRGIVFVDIDGTINNFNFVDHHIIKEIFGNHRLVMFFDKILWHINEFDFISNSMRIFKLRLFIYSIMSFTCYKSKMIEYESLYHKYTFGDVDKNYNLHLSRLECIGYKVILITHSEFTKTFNGIFKIIIPKNKPKYLKGFYKKNNVSFFIGNNYTDDLRTPIKLGISTIYIGKSKLVRKIILNRAKAFFDIEAAVDYVVNISS